MAPTTEIPGKGSSFSPTPLGFVAGVVGRGTGADKAETLWPLPAGSAFGFFFTTTPFMRLFMSFLIAFGGKRGAGEGAGELDEEDGLGSSGWMSRAAFLAARALTCEPGTRSPAQS